jgi:hypothetical protein
MRHVLLPGAPATASARLVALAGGALGLMPGLLRAAASVNLAMVATAADEHLSVAAPHPSWPRSGTHKQPGRPFHRISFVRAWTTSATGGILPRHACSAPCGPRRRTRTWRFRSAPCLLIRQVAVAPIVPSRMRCSASCRWRAAACGYVDNARALHTYPQAQQTTNSSQHQYD